MTNRGLCLLEAGGYKPLQPLFFMLFRSAPSAQVQPIQSANYKLKLHTLVSTSLLVIISEILHPKLNNCLFVKKIYTFEEEIIFYI